MNVEELGGWSRLFEDTQPTLIEFARRRVPAADAADAVAETFARALAQTRSWPEPPGVGWLFGILRNVLHEQGRQSGREWPTGLVDGPARWCGFGSTSAAEVDFDDGLVAAEESARVRAALERLADEDRTVVVLRVVEGRGSSEVGRLTGRSPAAVRMAQTRAVRRLASMMDVPERLSG